MLSVRSSSPQRDVVPLGVVGIHQDVNRAPALEGELVEHRHSVKGVHLPRLRVLPLSRQVAATWELFDRGDDGSHPHATLFKSLDLLRSIKEQTRKEQEESYEQDDCGFHDWSLSSLKTCLAAEYTPLAMHRATRAHKGTRDSIRKSPRETIPMRVLTSQSRSASSLFLFPGGQNAHRETSLTTYRFSPAPEIEWSPNIGSIFLFLRLIKELCRPVKSLSFRERVPRFTSDNCKILPPSNLKIYNEEALYVIDALCHHESDLHIREHYTDTGGSTEQVFALATLLGFRFAPRISDALAKKLYVLGEVGTSESLKTLLFEQVNKKLIVEQWGEMQRVASSIRHGTVSASLLMRKLAAYPRQNQVARALTEFGKLERTAFLLEYFRDAALRRRILIGLNKGEALHSLARQLFFGRLGELRDRALEDQIHRASCLHLLIAAIAAWNTIYLTEAFATLRRQGEAIAETTVAHIAPLGWDHINLIGKYQFAPQSGRSLENLRPLRQSVTQEGEETAQEAAS